MEFFRIGIIKIFPRSEIKLQKSSVLQRKKCTKSYLNHWTKFETPVCWAKYTTYLFFIFRLLHSATISHSWSTAEWWGRGFEPGQSWTIFKSKIRHGLKKVFNSFNRHFKLGYNSLLHLSVYSYHFRSNSSFIFLTKQVTI